MDLSHGARTFLSEFGSNMVEADGGFSVTRVARILHTHECLLRDDFSTRGIHSVGIESGNI